MYNYSLNIHSRMTLTIVKQRLYKCYYPISSSKVVSTCLLIQNLNSLKLITVSVCIYFRNETTHLRNHHPNQTPAE